MDSQVIRNGFPMDFAWTPTGFPTAFAWINLHFDLITNDFSNDVQWIPPLMLNRFPDDFEWIPH